MPIHHPTTRGSLLAAAMLSAVASISPVAQQGAPPTAGGPPAGLVVDVVATDRTGALLDNLEADDFVVTVNGIRQRVASIRYVTRGPGATNDTLALQATRPGTRRYAAEPARTVIIVVDQTTLARGDERATTAAVRRVVDRLGLDDRVGLVRLPLTGRETLELSQDRPSLVASLRQVMGQVSVAGPPPVADIFPKGDPSQPGVQSPERSEGAERAGATEPERTTVPDNHSSVQAEPDGGQARGNLAGVRWWRRWKACPDARSSSSSPAVSLPRGSTGGRGHKSQFSS
jgi:hypothetical protein